MNKNTQGKNNSSSSDNSQRSYEVQKIINQRFVDGQKQYKVIWVGYTFEEATWQPMSNLNCPQKIEEFNKRYQDVLRKKNLPPRSTSQVGHPQYSANRPFQSSLSQPKLPQNPASILNRDKLKASIEKTNMIKKNNPDVESIKQRIMTPQQNTGTKNLSIDQKIQPKQSPNENIKNTISRQTVLGGQAYNRSVNNQLSTNRISITSHPTAGQKTVKNSTPSKVIKIQQPSNKANKGEHSDSNYRKVESKLEHPHINQIHEQSPNMINQKEIPRKQNPPSQNNQSNPQARTQNNKQNRPQGNDQQRKINFMQDQDQIQQEQQLKPSQQIFISINQRLDIEKIICMQDFSILQDLNSNSTCESNHTPTYFLVKNKFCDKQRLVERQRIMNEQPLKLIEYYEDLLIENNSI